MTWANAVPVGIKQVVVTAKIRPMFGLSLDAKDEKVFVKWVVAGDASATAGISVGDVVIEIGGTRVNTLSSAVRLLAEATPGKATSILINRFGKQASVEVMPN